MLHRDAQEIADEAAVRTGVEVAEAIAIEGAIGAHALAALARHAARSWSRSARADAAGSGRVVAGSVPERLVHEGGAAVAVAPAGWSIGAPATVGSVGVGFDGGVESQAALRLGAPRSHVRRACRCA